jgi:hypothetical protein
MLQFHGLNNGLLLPTEKKKTRVKVTQFFVLTVIGLVIIIILYAKNNSKAAANIQRDTVEGSRKILT